MYINSPSLARLMDKVWGWDAKDNEWYWSED
jgi:hypothetical protein